MQFGGIVACFQTRRIDGLAAEKEVKCVNREAAVEIPVGAGSEQLQVGYFKIGFLSYFSSQRIDNSFVEVAEAAGQVECAFSRLEAAANSEKFIVFVDD